MKIDKFPPAAKRLQYGFSANDGRFVRQDGRIRRPPVIGEDVGKAMVDGISMDVTNGVGKHRRPLKNVY